MHKYQVATNCSTTVTFFLFCFCFHDGYRLRGVIPFYRWINWGSRCGIMFSAGLFPLPTPPSKQHGRLLRESCYFMTKPLSLPGGEESFVRGGRLWALGTGGDARVSSPLSGTRHLPTISSTASFWLGKCLSSAELFMRVCSTWWAWAHPPGHLHSMGVLWS